jgi:hypothetical protein
VTSLARKVKTEVGAAEGIINTMAAAGANSMKTMASENMAAFS